MPQSHASTSRTRPLVLAAGCFAAAAAQAPGTPIMKHSFMAPFEAVNDFTGMRVISDWELGGSAVAHRGFVRLTAEKQSQKGWIANRNSFEGGEWSLAMELRATGESQYLFGDGLAIWFTTAYDVIEGPVFGREDYWTGLGIFFDTFQNVDQQHHHKHPYIYAMVNDGTQHYVPDAEKKLDKAKQILPGAHDNSGCSFDFRYNEARQDVSVLNHTRVHVTYSASQRRLNLRLQQTSVGHDGEWYQCLEAKDVELPSSGYFAISSATGDLVDNHDIMHFVVRGTEGVDNVDQDHQVWLDQQKALAAMQQSELDLRPAEAVQRDYARALAAHTASLKALSASVDKLQQQMEFQLASIQAGVAIARTTVDDKANELREVKERVEKESSSAKVISELKKDAADEMKQMKTEFKEALKSGGGMSNLSFYFLLLLIVALGGVGYNRYRKIMKSHLL